MFRINRIVSGKISGWILPALLIILWEIASRAGWISASTMAPPSAVAEAFWRLLLSGELLHNIAISTVRALSGFMIGGTIGLVFGLMNGLSALSRNLTDTTLQMIRNIPHLALIPLVILWFGIDEEAKLFLVALGVFFRSMSTRCSAYRASIASLLKWAAHTACRLRRFSFRSSCRAPCRQCRRAALCTRHHVAYSHRRGDHRCLFRPRLHGNASQGIPADRRRVVVHYYLRLARKAC